MAKIIFILNYLLFHSVKCDGVANARVYSILKRVNKHMHITQTYKIILRVERAEEFYRTYIFNII